MKSLLHFNLIKLLICLFFCRLLVIYCTLIIGAVVLQPYESEAANEYVIRGNSALIKCVIPSYVADLVYAEAWLDSQGLNFMQNNYGNYGEEKENRANPFPQEHIK